MIVIQVKVISESDLRDSAISDSDISENDISSATTGCFFLPGPPLNFLSTGSHANWPGISLSVSSHKGILYLENLGGVQFKKNHPVCAKCFLLLVSRVTSYNQLVQIQGASNLPGTQYV
jgi:hypothetical protein